MVADLAERRRLFESCLPMAHKVSEWWKRNKMRWRFRWDRADVRQEMLLELWRCTERFDPDRGVKFSTVAWAYLQQKGRNIARGEAADSDQTVPGWVDWWPRPPEANDSPKDVPDDHDDIAEFDDGEEREWLAAEVQRGLSQLSPECRAAVRGRMEGRTLEDMARECGRTQQRMSQRVDEGMKALHRHLKHLKGWRPLSGAKAG